MPGGQRCGHILHHNRRFAEDRKKELAFIPFLYLFGNGKNARSGEIGRKVWLDMLWSCFEFTSSLLGSGYGAGGWWSVSYLGEYLWRIYFGEKGLKRAAHCVEEVPRE